MTKARHSSHSKPIGCLETHNAPCCHCHSGCMMSRRTPTKLDRLKAKRRSHLACDPRGSYERCKKCWTRHDVEPLFLRLVLVWMMDYTYDFFSESLKCLLISFREASTAQAQSGKCCSAALIWIWPPLTDPQTRNFELNWWSSQRFKANSYTAKKIK